MLYIRNRRANPREVEATNYWGTPAARYGHPFLSFSAGEFRLLVIPEVAGRVLPAVRAARHVTIERGPYEEWELDDVVLITWEDGSYDPWIVRLCDSQFDLIPYQRDIDVGLALSLWSPDGRHALWPARYRHRLLPSQP